MANKSKMIDDDSSLVLYVKSEETLYEAFFDCKDILYTGSAYKELMVHMLHKDCTSRSSSASISDKGQLKLFECPWVSFLQL